ncbi:hypothetical protein Kpho02_07970 [Kitasatospora phosalacinea]|uniref:Uncharacterized protein n=1 Tax=Kitasatospora phosalacinea TaxID=2065 RepID=A0A9W6Q4X2_9ACTN|nr:hypothetical protein [Kitasatospora phosalacinea]GLW68498.1 hypothetical protein Kpho02_07970 [Kitasatospora phosalacinea]
MVWQFFVLVIASIGFPTLTLLFMIGGLEYREDRQHPKAGADRGAHRVA